MLKTLIIAILLLPSLTIAQQSHQMTSDSYCVSGFDKASKAVC